MKNLRDSFKDYKKEVAEPLDIKVYLSVSSAYIKFLMQKVFDGEEVTLPSRMGILSVLGKKQKISFAEDGTVRGLAPDWVKTKQLWDRNPEAREKKKLVYHTNPHTNNVRYKFVWSKNRMAVENKSLYSLRFSRSNKRTISQYIKNKKEYLIV